MRSAAALALLRLMLLAVSHQESHAPAAGHAADGRRQRGSQILLASGHDAITGLRAASGANG